MQCSVGMVYSLTAECAVLAVPKVESAFFNKSPKIIGERNIWDTKDISEGGHPFKRKLQNTMFVRHFKFIRDFISPITHTLRAEDEVKGLVGKLNLPVWRKMAESITAYLLRAKILLDTAWKIPQYDLNFMVG